MGADGDMDGEIGGSFLHKSKKQSQRQYTACLLLAGGSSSDSEV